LLVDLYNHGGALYLHPLKVWERFSPTMFLPHRRQGEEFVPLSNSYDATTLFGHLQLRGIERAEGHLDYWDRLFIKAADASDLSVSDSQQQAVVDQLCRILLGREDRMLSLARDYFTLADLLRIKSRLIGTGFIGGKAAGMLLARKMLARSRSRRWNEILEPHDSWHIGSDLFYSYIVHNGWWRLLMQQKSREGYFSAAARLRVNLLHGTFPEETREEFQKMLEYFGQYPIIVRSSSLLEDGFGNAFAGKYDSFFCVNQGSPEQRCRLFEDAIRRIFASMMGEEALSYRLQRGLDQQDEQMALLVQRVSGTYHRHYFFPDLAGVGISCNTFVWNRELDPRAGMLRLVFGLGTRAVDRVEDDYPRLVALDKPLLVPQHGREVMRRYSQRCVDLLNIADNTWQTLPLQQLLDEGVDFPMELFGTPSPTDRTKDRHECWILDFAALLGRTDFPALMRELLSTLEGCYRYPVDVEFTANFSTNGRMHLNLVQCRPLQTKGMQGTRVEVPDGLSPHRVLFRSIGNFMGGSIVLRINRVILIVPEQYEQLALRDKYDIARLIGRLNRLITDRTQLPTMLLGPGRFGTSTPSLGVPVSFGEISNMTALCEVAFSAGGLMPELSFGTHFFQDLVESGIFYAALFPDNGECTLSTDLLAPLPNRLRELLPEYAHHEAVVRVFELSAPSLKLLADVVSQKVLCFFP
ncbi:MAG TPA: PEP/pyruvate-binding domain-containing protein, partial [Geobacteraceae bacterium]